MNLKISPAEWEVLDVVWDKQPVAASGVYDALAGEREWHPKTVNTFLARLVEKGILSVHREGKANVYSALVSRDQCVQQESESFLTRVFRGATAPLVAHFCEHGDLSDEEIAELQKLLKRRAKKGTSK